jgi:cobyrinic acid a,c-diamide synthase
MPDIKPGRAISECGGLMICISTTLCGEIIDAKSAKGQMVEMVGQELSSPTQQQQNDLFQLKHW